MSDLSMLLIEIKQYNYKFLDSKNLNKKNFKIKIFTVIKNLFPILNPYDIDILQHLTAYLIERIAFFMFPIDISKNYQEIKDYYTQFTQNNYRDVKSICLMILPYINTESNPNSYQQISNLQQILFTKNKDFITTNDINKEEKKSRMNEFKFSNIAVSLFNKKGNKLINLKPNNIPLIYDIIYHNFFSILSTLQMVNGKLFINWINITPLNLENYKKSKLYKNTKRGFDELINLMDNNKFFQDFFINYNGLWIGDFYNVYRMIFYNSIKKLKWLIFPYKNTKNKYNYIIQILDLTLIKISTILNKDLIDHDKIKLKIDNIIYLIKSKNNYQNISYQAIKETYKYLLLWFVNNYKYRSNISKKLIEIFLIKKPESFDNHDEIVEISKFIQNINSENIISGLEIIKKNIDNIYYFLVESIFQFKGTFYGSYLINEDNTINHSFSTIENTKNKKVNLKNLYNYAKSLSIETDNKFGKENIISFLPENFKALTILEKQSFLEKISGKTNIEIWYYIKDNIKRQENNNLLDKNQINIIYNQIVEDIKEIKFDLIFEALIKNGLISEFKTDLELTDSTRLPKETKRKEKKLKKE